MIRILLITVALFLSSCEDGFYYDSCPYLFRDVNHTFDAYQFNCAPNERSTDYCADMTEEFAELFIEWRENCTMIERGF